MRKTKHRPIVEWDASEQRWRVILYVPGVAPQRWAARHPVHHLERLTDRRDRPLAVQYARRVQRLLDAAAPQPGESALDVALRDEALGLEFFENKFPNVVSLAGERRARARLIVGPVGADAMRLIDGLRPTEDELRDARVMIWSRLLGEEIVRRREWVENLVLGRRAALRRPGGGEVVRFPRARTSREQRTQRGGELRS